MTYDIVENTLKSLLQSNIKVISKKRQLGFGVVQLFEIKDFNIKLIFNTGKKLEILYPYNIFKENGILYFDYRLVHIHQDDVVWRPACNRLITNQRNKYNDLLLSIEQV
tara:strand:- start:85 stop:411 length:327 start_codon:yes stop_codon:yes gene_type:complete